MDHLSGGSLTEDLLIEILKRVRVKSLLRFMCVSKLWCNLITNPYFVSSHLRFNQKPSSPHFQLLLSDDGRDFTYTRLSKSQKLITEHLKIQLHWKPDPRLNLLNDPNKVKETVVIRGHCNGIVCAQTYFTPINVRHDQYPDIQGYFELQRLIIYNPITRRSQILPESDTDKISWSMKSHVSIGFGFVDDLAYKVVRVIHDEDNYIPLNVPPWAEVYDSRCGSWERVSVDLDLPYQYYLSHGSVYNSSDGCLYWIGNQRGNINHHTLVSFNLVDQEWNHMQCPNDHRLQLDHIYNDNDDDEGSDEEMGGCGIAVSVKIVGGSVAMFVCDDYPWGKREISVWKMKREEDMQHVSWTLLHNVKIDGTVLGFCIDGKHVLMRGVYRAVKLRELVLRDPEDMTDACFRIADLGYEDIDDYGVSDFVESLCLLNGDSGADKGYVGVESIQQIPEKD